MIFLALINNITLIIALSILYSFIIRRWKYGSRTGQVISGFLFGAVAVVGMLNPLIISPGLIFDGRSIIISIAGFIGGWITALIAALMSIIFRIQIGGPGAVMGVSVIASSAAIGVAYHYILQRRPHMVTPLHLIGFGIIVHICMLALTMTLPSGMKYEVLSNIAIPVIIIYPIGTLLVCVVLLDLESRIRTEDALRENEARYRELFENASEAIFVVQSGKLVFINPMTTIMTGYSGEELMSKPFTEFINSDDREMVYDRHVRRMKGEELPHPYSFRIIHREGNVQWVELNAVLIKWEGKPATLNFLSDITERKHAEEALRHSQSRLHTLVQAIPDLIWLKDKDGVYLSCNTMFERFFGAREADIVGKTDYDFVDRELADFFREHDNKAMAAGKPTSNEEWITFADDGHRAFLETIKMPIYDAWGTLIGVLGIGRDITDRKLWEEVLRERDIQFKKLSSWVPGMIYQFTKRPDGTYCVPFTTEAIKDIFGCTPQDVHEDFTPITKVILPEDFDKVIDSIEYSAKHLISWTCEYRVQIPGQSIRWISGNSTPEKLADDSITWYGFNTDITELKKTEETLRKSEEEFRSLAESMPQIVWVTRKDGWNIYFNQQWVDYTGLTLEESYGHGWNIPFHPEDRQRAWDAWQNATRNNDIYSLECRLRRADGAYRWWLIRGVPLLDETGEITKWFGTCTDIDNIKHAEKQLQDTLESLRKAVGSIIQVMVSAVESRDPYTAGHQKRSADLARAIAMEMGLPQEKIEAIRMAGPIHDIGKLSVPAEILSKPTKLTSIEFSLIKEHTRTGFEILKNVESPWPLAEIVYQHHERMDGSGYPRNLKGDEILIEARILAVSDVVESMASHRPYRPALGLNAAIEEIEKHKGTLYDADAVDACLRLFREKGFQLGGK